MRKKLSYTTAELVWIKQNCTLPRAQAHAEFCQKFSRADVSFTNYTSLCKRQGWLTGRDGRLQPGNIPWSKGRKLPFNPNSARTQFKKGQRPHNAGHAGHERLHEDGYVYVSINQKNPHTGYSRRYVLKHKYLWEQLHGPVPEDMCLKCIDGNRANADPSNWELFPRAGLPLVSGHWRLGYADAAPEVKPAILNLARLRVAVKHKKEKPK